MSNRGVAEAARSFVEEVWNSSDGLTRLDAWLTADYREHAYGEGRAGLVSAIRELRKGFPDAAFSIEGLLADGSSAALRMMLRATHTGEFRGQLGTGRPIEVKLFRWLRFEGNRVAEHWALLDTASLLRQLNS